MRTEDSCLESVATFDKFADRYAEKYFALDYYDRFYQMFAEHIPEMGASVVDIACGPGNVAAYLSRERPDVSVVGVDLAKNMVKQARARVPSAEFHVLDCRELHRLKRTFQGAAFAFGLSYLTDTDAGRFFTSLNQVLCPGGALLLSTITGQCARSGYESSSAGDRVFMVYRTPIEVRRLVESYGYSIEFAETVPSPSNATVQSSDVILVAKRALCAT
jgi:ubiquinone/menaquinone biosynthesis C-methylase UbiE